ncbi:ABC transporter ATP-binding protein [Caloramator sp. E03]|uniref:ABC transporter ATP-binding protein n=1 Tax=Caloramator sp. E03 TaxID=2576307 RepID=UPI0011109A14|nr:ABC transporter ATP-binding protein [Caloramator sp. E03]QCX32956.1 ABC transporter ATP-binding protein [Caloramator sp. E03]
MIKLFRYLDRFKWLVLFILTFMFFQAIAELYLPTLMSDIVNNGMMKGDTAYIWKYGGYMLLVAGASSISSIVGSFLSAKVAVGFGKILRDKVFTRVESYSLNEFDKIGTASMITRTTNDINQIQTVLVMMMRFMIYAPIMCIGGIIMAYSKDKSLTIILAVVLPIFVATIIILATKVVPMFKSLQKKLDKLNLILRENLIGIRVIRAFNRIGTEKERFLKANRDLTDTSIRVNKIMAAMQPIMILLMNFTNIAIIWFAGLRIGDNKLEIGDMMAFLQYAMQIMFSIIMVSIMFVMVPRAQASADRINEIFDLEPEINDPKEPKDNYKIRGHVEFKNVTFSYSKAEQPALCDISFEAKPGEITAIIGGTGSGKSTLVNLIPRFYDVDSGSVLVDGVDVREMSQKELRSKIGFVPQTAVLFSGTIKDNIKYGKDDATEEEIIHAAEVAQASEFISQMKDGYDSLVSQGGTNLSGGQKQRLSIARALVKRPEIYIFDESFSALDFKTDAQLRMQLKKETKNSTVLIVAQRVGTVMDADKIIVLDEGKIVGIGKHNELLKTCEVYREIVSSQLKEEMV